MLKNCSLLIGAIQERIFQDKVLQIKQDIH